jgi:phosphatidylglycerol:prolipoprotein diacylglycerol transferase
MRNGRLRLACNVETLLKPILFTVGDFSLHSFGVLVALGFMAGLWVASRNAMRVGINGEFIYDLAPWLIGGGLLGARVLYVVSYWDRDFAGEPLGEVFAVWRGGLVFYGGLIGATGLAVIRLRMLKQPVWRVADCLASGIALGHVFGRLGCLANGCCYGRPADAPWAVHYPRGHETFPIAALTPTAVHPAQLYEAALNLAFFGALLWLFRRRRFDGQVFAGYLIGYAFIRAVAELFRGDYSQQSAPLIGVFTPGQKTSVLILACGLSLWWWLRKPPEPSQP